MMRRAERSAPGQTLSSVSHSLSRRLLRSTLVLALGLGLLISVLLVVQDYRQVAAQPDRDMQALAGLTLEPASAIVLLWTASWPRNCSRGVSSNRPSSSAGSASTVANALQNVNATCKAVRYGRSATACSVVPVNTAGRCMPNNWPSERNSANCCSSWIPFITVRSSWSVPC